MSLLKEVIESSKEIDNTTKIALENRFNEQVVKRNEIFLKEGQYCNDLLFVEKGLLRAYYLKEGKEVTDWFGTEGTFMTSIHSFYNGFPSEQYIHGIEDTIIRKISKKKIAEISKEHPSIEKWFRLITTQHLTRLQQRITALQFYTAKERFALLKEKNPVVLQKAPVSHIASYLGISLETLSRVRAR
ncbi:Crp/Fnr family transcriptional regulator [Aquimarina sediminis]|uniref:Crp/Fnr family transcriptional regulator n=1 Tax=Aquimarina sediminis TaxID=2070536 RepID=UPI0013E8E8BA|nr:Crp/Fnr family transcriptional regulator [Aquimarina sediminis]